MTYGYIRVSTDKQTVENQRFEIICYAKAQNITIDKWIEETISGTVSPDKRNLGKLIKDGILSDIDSIHRITIDHAVEKKEKKWISKETQQ